MPLFETHCHLQDERLLPGIEEVLRKAGEAGVSRLLCCGVEEKDWETVLDLARRYGNVVPAIGLHPLYVAGRSASWKSTLEKLLKSSNAVIGEIGLDHSIRPRNDDDQEEVFLAQMALARELNRPVSIHCRQAWGRFPHLLESAAIPKAGAVIHSYSGGRDLVKPLTEAGFHISFSGSITRPNNRRGREAAAGVPWDRLLVETDAPDIMPMAGDQWPAKGAVNEPANLPVVVHAIAGIRGVTVEEAAERTWNNACRLFGEGKKESVG